MRIIDGALRCERDFELQGGIVPSERYDEVHRFTDACIDGDASDIVVIGANLGAKIERGSGDE